MTDKICVFYSFHLSQSMAIENINLPPHNIEAEKGVIS